MLSLTNNLNNEFWYDGKKYPINLSFDNVIRFYELLDDEHFKDSEKVSVAFEMFFGFKTKDPDFAVAAFQQINHYISSSPYGNDVDKSSTDMSGNTDYVQKYYSFKQDAEAIYASFLEQYGIDLIKEQGVMHWDEFKALFAGLGPKTYFKRIVDIRTRDTSNLQGQELTDVLEAQSYYELDENKTQAAKQQQMRGFLDTIKSWAKS